MRVLARRIWSACKRILPGTPAPGGIVCLEGLPEILVEQPPFRSYVERIRHGTPFALIKRTHGFWDRLVDLIEHLGVTETFSVRALREVALDEAGINELERRVPGHHHFWTDGFFLDLLDDLQNPPRSETYIEGISFRGWPSATLPHEGRHSLAKLREAYHVFHTSGRRFHDALVWKQAILDGEFNDFLAALRDKTVLTVGPPHLQTLGEMIGLPHHEHLAIHPTDARKSRDTILTECGERLRRLSSGSSPVALFQAGSLSYWLIRRLFDEFPHVYLLDLGRALDIWYPVVVLKQQWFQVYRARIVKRMKLRRLYVGL